MDYLNAMREVVQSDNANAAIHPKPKGIGYSRNRGYKLSMKTIKVTRNLDLTAKVQH